ncbi:MAG: hypothetical protein AB7R55_05980 [Gemmatimonadales bacterium]
MQRAWSSWLSVALAACAQGKAGAPPLRSGLGALHVPISSEVDSASRYFDQGMRLWYAFEHQAAARAFAEAGRLDPACAICRWGEGLALGPNLNAEMAPDQASAAARAIARAVELRARASARERALIDALATRLSGTTGADSAYAGAMADAAARFPDDVEILTLFADALMNGRPWDYWDGAEPRPGTLRLLAALDRALSLDSLHPGACHLLIHATEAAQPGRALGCAERLAETMPGAAHLVHMPAHLYLRLGRYDDAIAQSERAIAVDSTAHDLYFLAFAAMLAGRETQATAAAQAASARISDVEARGSVLAQSIRAAPDLIATRFERWDELLARPLPSNELAVARALAEFARGAAELATGAGGRAAALRDSLSTRVAAMPRGVGRALATLARHHLEAKIALTRGATDAAIAEVRAAAGIERALGYQEPPWWPLPTRQALGRALLEAGRSAEAAAVFGEDLREYPGNCWSSAGLARALGTAATERPAGASCASRLFD